MEIENIPLAERIDTLMREVIEDAEIRAEKKIRETEEKSRKMIRDATKDLEIEVDEMFEVVEEKIKKKREQQLLQIQSQVKKEIMLAKDEKIKKVLELIERQIFSFINDKRYKDYLTQVFKNMLNYIKSGGYILTLNKADIQKFSKMDIDKINHNKELKFVIAENEFLETHGIRLKSEDGRLMIEDTIETRFEKKKDKLRNVIATNLFKD